MEPAHGIDNGNGALILGVPLQCGQDQPQSTGTHWAVQGGHAGGGPATDGGIECR